MPVCLGLPYYLEILEGHDVDEDHGQGHVDQAIVKHLRLQLLYGVFIMKCPYRAVYVVGLKDEFLGEASCVGLRSRQVYHELVSFMRVSSALIIRHMSIRVGEDFQPSFLLL